MNENEMSEEARRTAEMATETAQELAGRAKGTALKWTKKAGRKARDVGAATDVYVRENAWVSVVITAAIAGIIGYVMGRSNES